MVELDDLRQEGWSDVADEILRLREALLVARRQHYVCDDCWYSCPKSEEGCCDPDAGEKCNCGADKHNVAINAALDR